MLRIVKLIPVFLLLGAAACDPCTGVVACTESPRISYQGEFISHRSRQPIRGVGLVFVRTGGVSIEPDSVTAVTDAAGVFRLTATAAADGDVIGTILVTPPQPWPSYQIADVRLHTSSTRGEMRFLDRWVVDPYLPYVGELFRRRDLSVAAGARVVFRRTGGIAAQPDSFTAVADARGQFPMAFDWTGLGELEADMVVRLPEDSSAARITSGIRLNSIYRETTDPERTLARWGVGGWLAYFAYLVWSDTSAPVVGATVEFRRTGGIALAVDTFRVTTGPDGGFSLMTRPLEEGEVSAELVVQPPGGRPALTIPDVRMQTFDSDAPRLLSVWAVPR